MPPYVPLDSGATKRVIASINPKILKRSVLTVLLQEAHALRAIMISSFNAQKGGGESGDRPWSPLAPTTIALRRHPKRKGGRVTGTKALVATGQMRKAIQVVKVNNERVFVGVPRAASNSGGGPVAGGVERAINPKIAEQILRTMRPATGGSGEVLNIAMLHEYGVVMRWTVKQRKWFWYMMSTARGKHAKQVRKGEEAGGATVEDRLRRLAGTGLSLLIIPARPFIGPSINVWNSEGPPRMATAFQAAMNRQVPGEVR